jgi:hypothetical protein
MESPDEEFEALRARYTSLRSSIQSELRAIGSAPRPAIRSNPPTLPCVRDEQFYTLRESLLGRPPEVQPYPSVESAIASHMPAQFAALHTSISTVTDTPTATSQPAGMATPPRTAPTAPASMNDYRPASGDEVPWTEPAAVASSPTATSGLGEEHGSVVLHANRPSCGPTPTLLTAHDIARTSASRHTLALRLHSSRSATSSPRRHPSAALVTSDAPFQPESIVFGHQALRAALASHRRHYQDSRDALRPTRKATTTEFGHGGVHSSSQLTPTLAAKRADRRSSSPRATAQHRTTTRTPNRAPHQAARDAATKSARPATRQVPLARPASAGATLRTVPMAELVHAASQAVTDSRQAQVLASMKQRSGTIHRNLIVSSR